jgi:hypothetical protein
MPPILLIRLVIGFPLAKNAANVTKVARSFPILNPEIIIK